MAEFIGFGTIFSRESATPDTYTDLAQIIEIGDVTRNRNVSDNMYFDSSSGYMEKIAGFRNVDDLSITLAYDPADATLALLEGDIDIATVHSYRITWSDADTTIATFDGLVTSVGIATPLEEKVTQAFTIAVSGAITFT